MVKGAMESIYTLAIHRQRTDKVTQISQ